MAAILPTELIGLIFDELAPVAADSPSDYEQDTVYALISSLSVSRIFRHQALLRFFSHISISSKTKTSCARIELRIARLRRALDDHPPDIQLDHPRFYIKSFEIDIPNYFAFDGRKRIHKMRHIFENPDLAAVFELIHSVQYGPSSFRFLLPAEYSQGHYGNSAVTWRHFPHRLQMALLSLLTSPHITAISLVRLKWLPVVLPLGPNVKDLLIQATTFRPDTTPITSHGYPSWSEHSSASRPALDSFHYDGMRKSWLYSQILGVPPANSLVRELRSLSARCHPGRNHSFFWSIVSIASQYLTEITIYSPAFFPHPPPGVHLSDAVNLTILQLMVDVTTNTGFTYEFLKLLRNPKHPFKTLEHLTLILQVFTFNKDSPGFNNIVHDTSPLEDLLLGPNFYSLSRFTVRAKLTEQVMTRSLIQSPEFDVLSVANDALPKLFPRLSATSHIQFEHKAVVHSPFNQFPVEFAQY